MVAVSGSLDAERVLRITTGSERAGTAHAAAAREQAADVPVLEVGSLGIPAFEPLVLCTLDGRTAYHVAPGVDRTAELAAALADGSLPAAGADAVVDHDPTSATLPRPPTGPLSVGSPRVTARFGWTDPTAVADPEADGRVAPTVAADPDAGFETVRSLGLLGRGRGDGATDTPVADRWRTIREADGDPVVVVNANESDDRVAGDRLLCESAPLDVLDGALAIAAIVGAADLVVTVTEPHELAQERLCEAAGALDSLADAGGADVSLEVVTAPDSYMAGEMTAALEAMEGADRLEARRRPPGPESYGLYGRPTAIHTPRTVAQVRALLADPDAFDADAADPGTRLVTVGGDVDAPATVELETGSSLARALTAVDAADPVEAACVGGVFGGFTRSLDVPVSAPALVGSRLGTNGALEVFGPDHCPIAAAGSRARFAMEENCGRCVPCREGSKQLTALLREVYDGEYDAADIRELGRVVRTTSLCSFGRDAALPVLTALDEFDADFRAHAAGRCPTNTCDLS
ncbi:NADH-ubiquinone oxidoreductase-F iron-sulfur binding region domain-containing protein [Haloferacaceae archaeon DSL9]